MDTFLSILQVASAALILVLLYRPLGDYMAHVYSSKKDLVIERGFYRLIGVDSRAEQSWQAYLRGVLAFSLVSVLLLYAIQRAQAVLPYSLGFPAIPEGLSFNTAISFVTNTNWQSYSPDVTMGYSVQLIGLAVQNFVSAAVGIAVAINWHALDFTRRGASECRKHDWGFVGQAARTCILNFLELSHTLWTVRTYALLYGTFNNFNQ